MAKFIEIRPDPRDIPTIKTLSRDFVPKRVPELGSNNYLYQAEPNSYTLFELQTGKHKQSLSVFSPRIQHRLKKTQLDYNRQIEHADMLPHPYTSRTAQLKQKLISKLENYSKTATAKTDRNQTKSAHLYSIEPDEILKDVQASLNKPLFSRATKLNPAFLTKYKAITHRKTQSISIYPSQQLLTQEVNSIFPTQTTKFPSFNDRTQHDERSPYLFSSSISLIKKGPKYNSLQKLPLGSSLASTCLVPLKNISRNQRFKEESFKIERMNLLSPYEDTLKSCNTATKLNAAVSVNTLQKIPQSVSRI